MVTRINASASLGRVLSYNEKKVAQNKATLLEAKNFLGKKDRLTHDEKFQRFQRLNDLNPRSQVNTLHISINFNPADHLSDNTMTAIADRYMQGLGFQKQPYLVYRHQDAGHPHCHIVTSLIRPDGRRIKTQLMGKNLSTPTRKAIEKEFNLHPAQQQQRPQDHNLQKITYGPDTPLQEAIDHNLQIILRDYHFTNLQEFNALLRTVNITADPGGPNSRTRQHRGLHYRALDDKGHKLGVPLKASQLPSHPTLSRLEQLFIHNRARRPTDTNTLRPPLDWALHQNPDSLRDLVADLQQEGIDLVLDRPTKNQAPHLIYIDHQRKTAITDTDLGQPYTASAILRTPAPGLHTRTPQLLSTLLQHDQKSGPDDFTQHQQPRQRPGR